MVNGSLESMRPSRFLKEVPADCFENYAPSWRRYELDDEGSSSTGITDCGDRPCGCTASLGVGTNHSCALRLDGQVVCWGANAQGELGMGTTSSPIPWPQLVPLPGELVPVEILDGNNHSCARAANDAVICGKRWLKVAPANMVVVWQLWQSVEKPEAVWLGTAWA